MVVESRVSNASHHSVQTQIVHREERQIEKHKHKYEMHFAPKLVHHPTEHFRVPEIDPGEYPKQASAEKDIVNMSDNEIGVMNKEIHRSRGHVDAA